MIPNCNLSVAPALGLCVFPDLRLTETVFVLRTEPILHS